MFTLYAPGFWSWVNTKYNELENWLGGYRQAGKGTKEEVSCLINSDKWQRYINHCRLMSDIMASNRFTVRKLHGMKCFNIVLLLPSWRCWYLCYILVFRAGSERSWWRVEIGYGAGGICFFKGLEEVIRVVGFSGDHFSISWGAWYYRKEMWIVPRMVRYE